MSLPHWLPRPYDIVLAFGLLTRLPIPASMEHAKARGAYMAWAYALVGAALGALAALLGLEALKLGLPVMAAAILATAAVTFITGAMHEDGLADVCDGFWGGWDKTRRLEIMKDSHIGVYGTYGLITIFALRVAALAALLPMAPWALVGIYALSRAGMAVLSTALPNARGDGLSHAVGASSPVVAAMALGLGLCFALATAPWISAIACLTATAAIGILAHRKIGGQTGDVLGASQVMAEVAGLLIAATIWI